MPDSDTHSHNKKIAKTLLVFAWVIEGCAVITGLVISMMVAQDTYTKNNAIDQLGATTGLANVIIAALPFVMVSIVELAKIPTAQAVYVTKHPVWKALFIIALLFLALITFETALNGFERNYRNLNYQVTQKVNVLEQLEERMHVLEDQNARDASRTREMVLDHFDREIQSLKDGRNIALEALKEQGALVSEKASNIQIAAIKQEIQELRGAQKNFIETRDKEIADIQNGIELRIKSASDESRRLQDELKRQLVIEEDKLRQIELDARRAVENANLFNRSRIQSQYQEQKSEQASRLEDARNRFNNFSVTDNTENISESSRERIDSIYKRYAPKLADIKDQISDKSAEIAKISGVTQKYIDSETARINLQRSEILSNYESDKISFENRKEIELNEITRKEQRIQLNETEMRALEEKISSVKSEINELAKDNQIYRIGKMFDKDAKTVSDVPSSVVDMVAKIWFGSLAMVIAITGILLALASQVVRDRKNTSEVELFTSKYRRVSAALRSIALAINRRTRRKPKEIYKVELREIVKEVPVDKVVFKEVVKEVVRKELVHVPFYTNDQRLVGGKNDQST